MFKTLGWLSVEDCLNFQTIVFIYKTELGLFPKFLNNLLTTFTDNNQFNNTKDKKYFVLSIVKNQIGRKSVLHKKVMNYVRFVMISVTSFKRQLKKKDLNMY